MATPPPAGLRISRVPLDSLHPDPANARSHGQANMESIRASLRRWGQVEPLVVQRGTSRIIGGNGRYLAMRELGWQDCDVVEVEQSDLDATALGIALNRTAELAEWDGPALGRLLEQLRLEDGLEGVGFSGADIDQLLSELQDGLGAKVLADEGPVDPPEDPVSRLGDLWILGDHRILCGDSTKAEDLARLMAGEKASLLATDPPYLVDYDGTNHPADHHRKAGRTAAPGKEVGNKHWDAYVDPTASVDFFSTFLREALKHCIERVPIYQWHATRRQALVEQAWKQNGLLVHQTVVWTKARGVLTRSHFLWQHEPCFYGWIEGNMPEKARRPDTTATTVWAVDQQGEPKGLHPTIKPVEIFLRPIGWHTLVGEICLEPFSGSGTQIIAAETLSRRCFAMELSPGFVDAAVLRWQKATGRDAVLDGTGQTYAQVARDRRGA